VTINDSLSLRRQRAAGVRPDSPLLHVDWVLIGCTLILSILGLVLIHSTGANNLRLVERQSLFVVLGLGAMVTCMSIDYRLLLDNAVFIYGGSVALLVGVLLFGQEHKGAQGWFDIGPLQMQPAEFAKIGVIIALAAYGSGQRNLLDARRFTTIVLLTAIPTGLIYLQPDLGSALVFLAIVLAMLWIAGAPPRLLGVLVGAGVLSMFAAVKLGVLKKFQLDRLLAFTDPEGKTSDIAFNITQSKIAIGSGGLVGKGLNQGTQTQYGFVPEQHSDFIFTALGEQLGLIGCATALLVFAVMLSRVWRAAASARDSGGTLICVGVFALIMFHIFQNVGMTMGIMPITGIPLPFLSYGGSSTLTSFAALGLVLSVEMRRFR
jgi:rod shape determining protein RodA